MSDFQEFTLVRIFLGEGDKIGTENLYSKIMSLGKEKGLSGLTITRGVAGFGQRRKTHTAKILRLSEDLPLVIELIDTDAKVDPFLESVDDIFEQAQTGGLVSKEKVKAKVYKSSL